MSDFMNPAPKPATSLGYHRILSSTAGIRVSPLALGAMSIGEAWSIFMGSMDKERSFQLLDGFFNAGGNFIDTANDYQNGESETWIGEWMESRKNRDQVVIATKYSFHYRAHTNPEKTPANNNFWGNHRKSMHMSLRDSLVKLQTDFVDIFYVHFWDFTTSIEEVMDALHILVTQGKVLYLGISDAPAWVVSACNYYARDHGKTPFSVYQGRWNLLLRDLEREIIPMAFHFGMAIVPWGALGGGKFRHEDQLNKDSDRSNRAKTEQSDDERKASRALLEVAKAHNTDSVTAVALAYVRCKAPNVIPLIGGRKVEHLEDNLKSLDLNLTDEEIDHLEKVKEFDVGFPANFAGQDWRMTRKEPLAIISQGPVDFVR